MAVIRLTYGKLLETDKLSDNVYKGALEAGLIYLLRSKVTHPDVRAEIEAALIDPKDTNPRRKLRK